MSISRQNLSIVIVTFKSEDVIHQCIQSIDSEIDIIVVENSDNEKFQKELEEKYSNVKCYISKKNLGMGAGNNLGFSYAKTDYVLLLNPDVIFEKSMIDKIILGAKKILSFTILSPQSSNIDYPNYKLIEGNKNVIKSDEPFKVKSVDGFAMLFDKKKLRNLLIQKI